MSEPVDPNAVPPAPPVEPPSATPAVPDPLVVPPGSSFNDWYNKVFEIGRRSWRSVLTVTVVAIAAPAAIVDFISWLSYGYYAMSPTLLFHMGTFFGTGRLLFGGFITFVFSLAASFFIAAGWAAAVWTVVQEASGQRTTLNEAINYGLKRAGALWIWTVAVGVIVAVGLCLLVLPGIYAAFALSFFGFVVVFERDQNPVSRSFKLTHADLGSTVVRVLVLAIACGVYSAVINTIIGGIEGGIISNALTGFDYSFGARFGVGIVSAIGQLLVTGPVSAALLMGLLPIYAEQRAREGQMSTSRLQQELGT